MAIADQQNRRRARFQQYQSEQARNLAGLIGAVDDVGEEADADAMAKAKAEALASDTGARKTQAEAALLRAKTAADANADAILRKKTDDSARIAADEAKAAKLAREESVLRRKSSEDTLRTRLETGTPGATPVIDDPALEELDDDAVRTIEAQVAAAKAAEAEKKRAADAKIKADEALAAQRLRVPTGGRGAKPVNPDVARKLKAEADKAEADAKKAARDAAGDGKPVKPMLTPAEVEGVVELQGARDMIGRLEKMKKSGGAKGAAINTGPLEALGSWFASKVGVESPEKTEFKALAGEQIAGYIKNISGATVSEPERKSLLENIPSASDDDEEFLAKLKTVKDTLDAKLRLKEKAFSATGRDTSIFGEAPAAAKKPADMSDVDIEARLKELKAKR
jgi:hypothetical protein